MNFIQMLNADNIGALNFIDENMKPVVKILTISRITLDTPPVGKVEKTCYYFEEFGDKKCFLASGEGKKIMRFFRRAETDSWIGAKLSITCAPKRLGKKDVMGMVIVHINGQAV